MDEIADGVCDLTIDVPAVMLDVLQAVGSIQPVDHVVAVPLCEYIERDHQVGRESEFCATDNVEDVESGPELASNIQCVV
jgi:hypothetical protein